MSAKIQKVSKQVRVEADIHRRLKRLSWDEEETITKLITRLLKPHLPEYEVVKPENN